MKNAGLKVFAPASVSNLACGFDALGFALERPGDEVVVRESAQAGLRITAITGDGGRLPREAERNTAGLAALRLLQHLGEQGRGIEMEIHKKMPFGSGLGSSAASAVAGVFAVNELLGRPLEKPDLLPFALQGEELASGSQHADNVAPSLLGGLQLIRSHEPPDLVRLPLPPGLHTAVIYPRVEVLTKAAREILKPEAPLKAAVQQAANLGALVAGFFRSDLQLISRSLQDHLIEHQRAPLIPHFYEAQEAALSAGALGCSISGSGPSIFALCHHSLEAEQAGEALSRIYADAGIEYELFLSPINQEGATLY